MRQRPKDWGDEECDLLQTLNRPCETVESIDRLEILLRTHLKVYSVRNVPSPVTMFWLKSAFRYLAHQEPKPCTQGRLILPALSSVFLRDTDAMR